MKADGTPKYDTNAIPADKMAEFAKASTAREAYQMAVAYLTNGANNSADLYADAAAASGSSSGGSSSSSSSSSTPSANKETPAEKGNTEVNIDAALNDAKLLEQNGGFKKTDITYDQYVTALKSAKTPEALKVLQNKIAPALAATPQVSKSNELEIQKKAALAPYTSLSADQLAVLKASPWWSQISGLVEKVQGYKSTESKYAAVNLFTASDKTKLANAKNSLDIAIKKILAGKTNLAI